MTPSNTDIEKEYETLVGGDNICPDFDEDCKDIKDHLRCFLGLPYEHHGKAVCVGQAKGYCPFIHSPS